MDTLVSAGVAMTTERQARRLNDTQNRVMRFLMLRMYALKPTSHTGEELVRLGNQALELGYTDTARHGLQCAVDHIERTNGSEDGRLAQACLYHGRACEADDHQQEAEAAYLQGCAVVEEPGKTTKAQIWGMLASLYNTQRGYPLFRPAEEVQACLERAKDAGLVDHPLWHEYQGAQSED